MNDRLALRPDLARCALEDRILPSIEFGQFPNPFLQVNSATNQLFVPGTSTSSAGISAGSSLNSNSISLSGLGSNPPGPQWYFIFVGGNASGVTSGSVTGGSLSIYSFTNMKFLPPGAYVHTVGNLFAPGTSQGGGSGDDSGGGTDTTSNGSVAPSAGGFGATFSSGYGFALGSGNNYGMFSGTGATALGSVPVHTYTGGGDLQDPPDDQNGTATDGNGLSPNVPTPWGTTPTLVPAYDVQGPSAKIYQNLLGKSPGQMAPPSVGPGTSMGTTSMGMGQPNP